LFNPEQTTTYPAVDSNIPSWNVRVKKMQLKENKPNERRGLKTVFILADFRGALSSWVLPRP
jgi:hypothetical protein